MRKVLRTMSHNHLILGLLFAIAAAVSLRFGPLSVTLALAALCLLGVFWNTDPVMELRFLSDDVALYTEALVLIALGSPGGRTVSLAGLTALCLAVGAFLDENTVLGLGLAAAFVAILSFMQFTDEKHRHC